MRCNYFKILKHVLLILLLSINFYLPINNSNALNIIFKNYPTWNNNSKVEFDTSSTSLVLNGLHYKRNCNSDINFFDYDLMYRENIDGAYAEFNNCALYSKYYSQIGLQVKIIAKLLNNHEKSIWVFELILGFLFAIAIYNVCLYVERVYGKFGFYGAIIFSFFSTGFNLFSTHIYFFYVFALLPFCISYIYEGEKNKTIANIICYHLILMMAFSLKFIMGMEFASIVVMGAILPLMIRKSLNYRILASIVINSIFSFLLVKIGLEYGRAEDIMFIHGRALYWATWIFSQSLENLFYQIIKVSLVNFIDFDGFGIPLVAMVPIFILLYNLKSMLKYEKSLLLFSLFGSVSWLLMQSGHILFHPRYATVVFAYPFGIVFSGYVGLAIRRKFFRYD